MQALYFALAVLTSGYSGVAYKKLSACSGNRATSFLMPVFWYLPLALVFSILALTSGFICNTSLILTALLGGASAAICAYSLLESMKANSFSLTIIITNLSFVFPIILSIIFLNENPHLFQLIGMLLAIAVILVLNVGKKDGKSSFSAILLAVSASLGNGLIDFAIKIDQYISPMQNTNSFFFFTYLFAGIICALLYAIEYVKSKNKNVWYCGPEAVVRWWHDRAKCTITEVTSEGFVINNPTIRSITIVLPANARDIMVGGQPCEVYAKSIGDRPQQLINIGSGRFRVSYTR